MEKFTAVWNNKPPYRRVAQIYAEGIVPKCPPFGEPVAVIYLGRNNNDQWIAEEKEPLMKLATLFASAPQLLEALQETLKEAENRMYRDLTIIQHFEEQYALRLVDKHEPFVKAKQAIAKSLNQ